MKYHFNGLIARIQVQSLDLVSMFSFTLTYARMYELLYTMLRNLAEFCLFCSRVLRLQYHILLRLSMEVCSNDLDQFNLFLFLPPGTNYTPSFKAL